MTYAFDDRTLERELREKLLSLNFHAFLRCTGILLEHTGYTDVRLAGRTGWVGRNRDGGYDLAATVAVPNGSRRIVVQAKQYAPERRIYQRTVDELRGVCLRAGAAEALLVTMGGFSETLDRVRLASLPVAPVRTIDGSELMWLLAAYGLGVREEGTAATIGALSCLRVDEAFFAEVEAAFPGIARPGEDERVLLRLDLTLSPRRRRSSSDTDSRDTKKAALPQRS